MDLSPFLKNFPAIREYRVEDDKEIFKIFQQYPMKAAGVELIYDRSPQFTSILKHQSDHHKTLVLEHRQELASFFSYSWGPRYVYDQIKTVAYIGDFRVQYPRPAAKIWREFYGRFLDFLSVESKYVDYFYTGILDSNTEAMNNLVIRGGKNGFFYHYLNSQIMINLLAQKVWTSKVSLPFEVSALRPDEIDVVRELLDQDHQKKLFGYPFEGDLSEWDRRQRAWVGWNSENFLVIREGGEIKAVCLPWSPTAVKRMVVRNAPLSMKWALQGLQFAGVEVPQPNQEIETLYLTHMGFATGVDIDQRKQMVQAFVHFIFRNRKRYKFHMLALADTWCELSWPLSKSYFLQKTKVNLFEVSTSPLMRFQVGQDLGFEMCLV